MYITSAKLLYFTPVTSLCLDACDYHKNKFTKFSFERQVLEAVKIEQEQKRNYILNSRTEYNHSSLPRLTTRLEDSAYQDWQQELANEKKKNLVIYE